jgi:hypothetical protein
VEVAEFRGVEVGCEFSLATFKLLILVVIAVWWCQGSNSRPSIL